MTEIRKETEMPTSFSVLCSTPARTTEQEEENKGIQVGKEVRLPLFADYMMPYIRDPQNLQKNF